MIAACLNEAREKRAQALLEMLAHHQRGVQAYQRFVAEQKPLRVADWWTDTLLAKGRIWHDGQAWTIMSGRTETSGGSDRASRTIVTLDLARGIVRRVPVAYESGLWAAYGAVIYVDEDRQSTVHDTLVLDGDESAWPYVVAEDLVKPTPGPAPQLSGDERALLKWLIERAHGRVPEISAAHADELNQIDDLAAVATSLRDKGLFEHGGVMWVPSADGYARLDSHVPVRPAISTRLP